MLTRRQGTIAGLALVLMTVAVVVYPAPGPGPITFSSTVNPEFGTLKGGAAGRTFILTTLGTITGPNASDYLIGAKAGSVNITADNNKSIDILATNFITNGGVQIKNVTCNYDNTGDRDCKLGFTAVGKKGTGKNMTIGLEITTTIVHGENDTASPSFDIVVNYI